MPIYIYVYVYDVRPKDAAAELNQEGYQEFNNSLLILLIIY